MEVVYKLWEGSWENDAVTARQGERHLRAARKDTQDSSSRQIFPHGGLSSVRAFSPADADSVSGRRVVQRPAVCCPACRMCVHRRTHSAMTAAIVSDLRERARAMGRDPASLKIFTAMTAIAAPTDHEAQAKLDRLSAARQHRRYDRAVKRLPGHRFRQHGPRSATQRAGDQCHPE